MDRDTRRVSIQVEGEINEQSLMKLRKDVTDYLAEVNDFLTECGYTEPESTDKIEVDAEETKLQATMVNHDQTFRVRDIHLDNQRQIEAQFRVTQEDERRVRKRIVLRMKTQNSKVNEHIETPVPVVSKIRKRKLEVVIDNEPSMERLVQPVKRRVVFDLRQSVGKGFKTQDDHSTSGSVLGDACAPREDLRKVLQRRRSLCC